MGKIAPLVNNTRKIVSTGPTLLNFKSHLLCQLQKENLGYDLFKLVGLN